ncbi:hypothetical protein PTKIN_Ptkin08bG0175600 [Pterospermum kingtungense]
MAYPLVPLLVLALAIFSHIPAAQPVSPAASIDTVDQLVAPNAAREFLDAHNQARAAVGVGPLKWSNQLSNATDHLARYQSNRMGCQFANLTGYQYGANQVWSSGIMTPKEAVDTWVKEKNYYDYANNSCAPNRQCGLYTQVVWKNTSELGCAQASCKNQVTLTICFYNPPGNYVGERPY